MESSGTATEGHKAIRSKKRFALLLLGLFLFGVMAFVYYGQSKKEALEIHYSGTIEAVESNLSFQVAGKVMEVLVREGMRVKEGDVISRLEDQEYRTRLLNATALREEAEANVNRLESLLQLYRSTIPQVVRQAEAEVLAIKATLEELEAGFRVQEVAQARAALEASRLRMEEARKEKERFERLFGEGAVALRERDKVVLAFETAQRDYLRAREALDMLEEGYRDENIRAARARLMASEARLEQAKAEYKKIQITEEELKIAMAKKKEAEASERLAGIYLGYTLLKAPFDGIITSRNMEPGEVVTPQREVISIADLKQVDLKVYVGEPEIGKIRPGQEVLVSTDSFPKKTFKGRVTYISPQAEFTPKIIQTQKERVKLVYLVKISVPNPDLELKPGMPADAWFR